MTSYSKLWQEDAERELHNAHTLRSSDTLAAYLHLEQAVEKSVKAVIVYHSSDIDPYDGPREHSILRLLKEFRKRTGDAIVFFKHSLEDSVRNGNLTPDEATVMWEELSGTGRLFSHTPRRTIEIEESIELMAQIFNYRSGRNYVFEGSLPTETFTPSEEAMQHYFDSAQEFINKIRSYISRPIVDMSDLPAFVVSEEEYTQGGEAISMMLQSYREFFPQGFGQVSDGILLPDATRDVMEKFERDGTLSFESVGDNRSGWFLAPIRHRDGTERIVLVKLASAQESYISPEAVKYTFYTEWEEIEVLEEDS